MTSSLYEIHKERKNGNKNKNMNKISTR